MPELPDVIHLPGPTVLAPKVKASRSGSEQRARSGAFYIRVTDSERQEIEAAAKAAGIDPGTYARQMALTEPEERGSDPHITARTGRLPLRVSDAERAQIEDFANRAGLTPGSYIRARSLKRSVTLTTRRPPVEKAELGRLLGLLGNVASNVNQIAAQLNSEKAVPLVDVREVIAAVQDAAGQIIETMGRASKPRDRR